MTLSPTRPARGLVRHLFFVPLVLATTLLPAPPAPAQDVQPIDSIVAVVESDVILRSELDLAVEGVVERIRAQGGSMPPQDLLESQVLERLIVRKLQVQSALRTGIRVSDQEIDQALVTMAQQNGINVAQMRQVIENGGEDFSEFRRNVGEELMADKLMQRVVGGMTPVSEAEIDIMLAEQGHSGGEYNLSHIMVSAPDGSNADEVQAAVERISDIYQQLRSGADFAATAISYSESQEALEGGEVGWRDLNSVPAAFADAVADLEPGEFTQPIRSPGGFHILKVNDYRERQPVVVEEYSARHILVEPSEVLDNESAMNRIIDIRDRIREGEDFGDLAREYSDDITTANIGGDMGWFPPDAYGPRVQETVQSLDDGEVSEPFQSPRGWHIIQRLGARETDMTSEAIRDTARQTISRRRADEEIEKYIRQMRDESYVEIRLPS